MPACLHCSCRSVGCIFGELLWGRPLFGARSEVEALKMQAALLGTPSTHIWPVSIDDGLMLR